MIIQILSAVFLLGICIFFHELGHFLMGKLVGVQPRIFSIGYGRALFFKKKGKTIYQITAIPIGGYVQFYGDDITREHTKTKKGHFFSVGPWKRILIALGGPLFSVLLGLVVIFILFASGWQPITNKINVIDGANIPARVGGLQKGDTIIAVNGHKTESFEEINFRIALAKDPSMKITLVREGYNNGKPFETTVKARAASEGSPLFIGIQPLGDEHLIVQKNMYLEKRFFRKDDKIISVNSQKVSNIEQLRRILNNNSGKTVTVVLERPTGSLFKPGEEETITYQVPVKESKYFEITKLKDLQTGKAVPSMVVDEWDDREPFKNIYINGKNYKTWNEFEAALLSAPENAEIRIQAIPIEGSFEFKKRGMLGVSLYSAVESEKASLPTDIKSVIVRTLEYPGFVIKSTLIGIYRIFQGKISFSKNISGPIKIMAFAAQSVSSGWETYWFLLANITIVLGIMNLLPIPVLDGGHIIFYLIEGLYKPLSPRAIASAVRMGMVFLLTLGVYVIWLDIKDLFLQYMG